LNDIRRRRCIAVTEVKGKSVPVLAECITLITISFTLVGNAKRQSVLALEPNCLLVDRAKLPRHPTTLTVLPQVIKD
jgi:hypothetical protein